MEIIAAFKKSKCSCEQYELPKYTYVVYVEPAYAGDNLNEAELVMDQSTFESYKVPTFHSRQEAYDYAFFQTFGDGWEIPED